MQTLAAFSSVDLGIAGDDDGSAVKVNVILPGLTSSPIGGYKVAYRYASDLAALGVEVTVHHCEDAQFRYPRKRVPYLSPGATILRALQGSRIRPARPTWFQLHRDVVSVVSQTLSLREVGDADATIATAAWTAEFVAALPSSAGGKFYLIQHYEDWWKYVDDTWRLPLTRLVISRWLQRKGHELGVECEYLPNAIDLDEFPLGPPIAERPLMVCALVSDVGWKRTDLIIEVLIGLRESRPDVSAHVFGTCVRPDGLPDWVQYSRSPDPAVLRREIYQRARVHICASDSEGWHLPPAEALASGCAVASTDNDGVRESAADSARFSPIGDAAALLQNTLALLDNPSDGQVAVDRFRRRAVRYTPHDAAARLMSILAGTPSRA